VTIGLSAACLPAFLITSGNCKPEIHAKFILSGNSLLFSRGIKVRDIESWERG
jgi:hypothetical protein